MSILVLRINAINISTCVISFTLTLGLFISGHHQSKSYYISQWCNLMHSCCVPQGPTIGDVDGDGHTDVVVPTLSGNIYVLSGKDGSIVRPYPYRTHGRVMNQVLLVDLSKKGEKKKGLTLVTTSFDGYLYIIDGPTSCTDVVDIGETS